MCHWTEYEQPSLQVRISEENATTQKFITAKIWGCASGPSPAFSSRGAKNQKEGPKTWRGDHIFKILYWMYAATRGPNMKWGDTDFKWGDRAPLFPPLATALLRVKTGEWNTLITASEQFTTEKWGFANVLPNTSSRAQKVCGCTGWRIPLLARSNLAKYTNWECA